MVEQGTHKPLVGGSNPPSATTPSSDHRADALARLAAAVADGAGRLGIPAEASVILAVSGGADSMAMLHGAARLHATDRPGWVLTVAHLDHALRPTSADDSAFVVAEAARLGIRAEVRRTDVAALARTEGRSLEEAGREARYRFFAQLAGDDGWVATAHTADDSVETVLLNLLRGSGLGGVRGVPARRGQVVRPLIEERRATLRQLLDDAGLPYRDDPTNVDPAHLRNRVRAELVPLLDRLRVGATESIGRFARLAAEDDEYLDGLARAELERRRDADGRISWTDPPHPVLGRRILRLAVGEPAASAERIEALLEAASGDRGGVTIELGGGRSASVRGRRIAIG